jgi:hypothetical protein
MARLRSVLSALLWFVREQALSVLAAALLVAGCAMWWLPLGLIVSALSLVTLEWKTGADWKARAG